MHKSQQMKKKHSMKLPSTHAICDAKSTDSARVAFRGERLGSAERESYLQWRNVSLINEIALDLL